MEPEQLIQGLQAGEEAAIEALVRAHEKNLYRLALSLLDDPAEAEEATQDAFLAVLKAIHSYRGEAALGTWMHRIIINLCRSRLRQRKVRVRLTQALQSVFRLANQDRDSLSESVALKNESDAEVWRAIQDLSEKHRLVVILYYYHDMPAEEIAQTLEIPAGTVYSRLETVHKRMRWTLRSFRAEQFLQGPHASGRFAEMGPALQGDTGNFTRKQPDGEGHE